MFGLPPDGLLTGILFGLIGVAVWAVPFVIAYYLYKRWRGDGPQSRQ